MTVNMAGYFGKGLSPQQFMAGMTRNRDAFVRWYDEFSWPSAESKQGFRDLTRHLTDLRCIIVGADWCGDVVRNVPVILRLMEEAAVPVEILVLEEHLELVDRHFLTMGGRSIPIVLFVRGDGEIVGKWGPRPRHVQEVMVEFKINHPDSSAPDYEESLKRARSEMMRRYGEGTAYQSLIVSEVQALLESNE
ncbi:thioredoxin-like protein [Alicyclobacillus sacchari]|uniref:Thioredoxin-like protein n=1 Tax=Alicyclobacillus sacchari TaxID=392010 RepID=A0A4R8LQ65_9BACL|nr:thioredoxin family protein [Alicyclobacillus sacchari]TDY46724.1 thioredoxin-like protein [Alicyclobacillus sacchari]GMA58697.1 thioredoxin [Alicyclobacillus sacchari]